MDRTAGAKAPMHLWIVGILSLLWNGFGGYDYLMTRTQGAAYIKSMMPGSDADGMMAYINSFPIWASAGWGFGVWGAVAGSILLLMRHRLAVIAFGISFAASIVGIGYQLMNPAPMPDMHEGISAAMPYVIILVAALLFLYARSMRAKGVLR